MALRQIRVDGDPILRKQCREVKEITPKIEELIDDMLETMYDANGVGLAAPQVTYIMNKLAEEGFNVKTDATTIKEAAQEILKSLR